MNRREFLKLGTAAIAAAALPKLASTADAVPEGYTRVRGYERFARIDTVRFVETDFDPDHFYGNSMTLTSEPTPESQQSLVALLFDDMERTVPFAYRDRVRFIGPLPIGFGREGMAIGWKYSPGVA